MTASDSWITEEAPACFKNFKNDLDELKSFLRRNPMRKRALDECVSEVFDRNAGMLPRPRKRHQLLSALDALSSWITSPCHFLLNATKTSCASVFTLAALYFLCTTHNVTQKFIMRNSQNYIYPVMRTVRLWTLPVVRNYQSLTDWHEEDCLVKNPFYQESFLDCWPCEDVRTMVDLSGLYNYSKAYVYNEKPFLVRDVMERKFTIEDLANMYKTHKIKLDRGTARFSSTNTALWSLSELVNKKDSLKSMKNFHVLWKVNRVAAARVLRKIFQRPYFVPNNSEVALQRFLSISGSEASQFFLPTTDFANVWVAQGQGHRLIVLDPTEPCQKNCSTLSVLLRPQDVLYYNWQFWKPRLLPARLSEDVSITYIGSFY